MKNLFLSKWFVLICIFAGVTFINEAKAKVSVLFHPFDSTLKEIVSYFERAEESIDIAIYNIDSSSRNKVIKFFKSEEVQKRIKSGDLEVRMIYEGYLGPEQDNAKCRSLEKLGIDVRRFVPGIPEDHHKAVDLHHKFAVIDGYTDDPLLVSGSANWSFMSRYHYDENILYFENEIEIAQEFQRQFNFLWGKSAEFGKRLSKAPEGRVAESTQKRELMGYFNNANFIFTGQEITKKDKKAFTLTNVITQAISRARGFIKIATTRISLKQVYESIKKAAKKGVKIDLVVNMDQYKSPSRRKNNKSYLLSKGGYPGSKNVRVRVKFYNLAYDKKRQMGSNEFPTYLTDQMHSKYLIVDEEEVLTGSFNWSPSGEYNHIENVIRVDGKEYPGIQKDFEDNFKNLFNLRHREYRKYLDHLRNKVKSGSKPKCFFKPMVLSYDEIDALLNVGSPYDIELKDFCN